MGRGMARYREFRIRRLSRGNLSPYMVLSSLIHLGLVLLLLHSLLHMKIPQPKAVSTIRLVSLGQPIPEARKPSRKKTDKRGRSTKSSRQNPPKILKTPNQPKKAEKPQDRPQPRGLKMMQSFSSSQVGSSPPLPDDLLPPPQAGRSQTGKPPLTLSSISDERIYQPAQPSDLHRNSSPKRIGGASTIPSVSGTRSKPLGPISVIEQLPSKITAARQTFGTGPASHQYEGFQAPADSMAISSPPPGKIAGLNPSEGGERYIPLGSNDPDLGPYLVYLKERILKFWRTPGGAKDLKGHVDMAFTVKRDGKVSNIQVMSSSGYTLLDQGVMAAINRAAPFRPIPEKIREKKLLLLGTFSYNQALRQKASQ